jgi:hypothetical protein
MPLTLRRLGPVAVVLGLAVLSGGGVSAAEPSPSTRSQITERLRSEFRYQPRAAAATDDAAGSEEVVRMDPFLVSEGKDRSAEAARIFQEQRQQALARRPSLEGGASIDLPRGTLGPRPYQDLLKEDARFKTHQAVTPNWNLLNLRF